MKYLRKFETKADKDVWLNSDDYVQPNVVLTGGTVAYNLVSPATIPIYIEALEDLTVKFSNTYEYSKDGATWVNGDSSTIISATAGECVYFRASGLSPSSLSGIGKFTISNGTCNVGGNVMSMVYGSDFKGKTEITASYQFRSLFNSASALIDASSMVLPATKLKGYCYYEMFYGCKSLVNAPALPATILATYCYNSMFYGCTSLVNAPELPATKLATYCYYGMFYRCKSLVNAPELSATTLESYCCGSMFYGCTSLVNAPELSATKLITECYRGMFRGCTSLVNAPALPATTLGSSCYYEMFYGCTSLVNAPALPATTLKADCYRSMFYGCTSLVNAPELPATTLESNCYYYMFNGCTSLVNAPALPATTLVSNCYYRMFYMCSKLNFVKAMLKTTPSTSYTTDWLNGVSATGTFVKNAAATWDVTGVNGIPEGWTVETAAA